MWSWYGGREQHCGDPVKTQNTLGGSWLSCDLILLQIFIYLQEKKTPAGSSNVLNRLLRKQCLWLRILLRRLVPTCTRFQWRIHDIVE